MSTQSDIAEKKEKALLELMGPKSDIEDRAKLAIAKHFDNNPKSDSSDLVLLGDIINDKIGDTKHQRYFNSIKKSKKKSHTHSNNKNSQENIEISNLSKENFKITQKNSIFQENYLDILISAADNIINKGEISLPYLNSTEELIKNEININESTENALKCRNFICNNMISPNSPSIYCKDCDEEYQNGNYCIYCKTIYKIVKIKNNRDWLQCFYCHKFVHIQCEEEFGAYYNISRQSMSKGFRYICPLCRKNKTLKKIVKKKTNEPASNDILYYKTKFKNKTDNKDIFEDFIKVLELDEARIKNNKSSSNMSGNKRKK